MTRNLAFIFSFFFLVFTSARTNATGPRNVTSSGDPIRWTSMPVIVHIETDLDVRGKDVQPLLGEALDAWEDPTESDVTLTLGVLDDDDDGVAGVDQTDVCEHLYDSTGCPSGPQTTGGNPLVIDEDGEITSDFFGPSNRFTTLGFASIITFNTATGGAVKGEAVFNASCLAGFEISGCSALNLSFSDDDFISFIVHEIGHFLGLDHSQVNLDEATDGSSSNDDKITTMFPLFIRGNGSNFKTLEKDDRVGIAQLYPAATFSTLFGSISGTVYASNGSTEVQCANVVARNVADPLVDAVSALSGDFSPAQTAEGSYELLGLTPGASYTLDLEPIGAGFTGASGYTPCRGSNGESSPPSFTASTSSSSFVIVAGQNQTVNCMTTSGCGTGGGSTGGSSSGGCSLILPAVSP